MANIIFFKTSADYKNTGEVLIYKSLLELLRNYGKVIMDDKNPKSNEFLQQIGMIDSERLSCISKLPFMLALLGHGTFLVTGVGKHNLYSCKAAIKNFLAVFFLIFARICGVKIIRLGMSIEIRGFLCRLSERLLAYFLYLYAVRDSISLDFVKRSGVQKAIILPDLSFAYNVKYGKKKREPHLALVLRPFKGEASSLWQNPMEQIICKFLEKNIDASVFIGFQHASDQEYSKSLYSALSAKFPEKIYFNSAQVTLENAGDFYGKCMYVLSNRLHSLLLSYKYGVLPVPLIHKTGFHKITGIFCDAGLSNWIRYIDEENYSLPNYEEIEKIYAKEKEYREELEKVIHRFMLN